MNGVVLWSDVSQHKAVIWCEDQGELAFYSQKQHQVLVDLHEGDLICFDLTLQQNKRMAENLQVLAESVCVGLAESLASASPDVEDAPRCDQTTAQIIPFSTGLKQKQRDGLSRRNYVG